MLYDMIRRRKSIRRYRTDPLPEAMLSGVLEHARALPRLFPEQPLVVDIITDVSGLFHAQAPHYLGVFVRDDDDGLLQAGYAAAHMDLWLSEQGWGACMLGKARPPKAQQVRGDAAIALTLAFGTPDEAAQRQDVSAFKRKPIEEICDRADAVCEAIRLAPSAMNSQPWFYAHEGDALHAYCAAPKPVVGAMLRDMNRIDMGISLAYLDIAARAQGMTPTFARMNAPERKGYTYLLTARLSRA